MALQEASYLSPRDLMILGKMKSKGFALIEITINQFSALLGRYVESICLPELTRIICLYRNGEAILDFKSVFLEEGDSLHLLTEDEARVRETFMIVT